MRILTVRQPWAWAIIHGGKNVENRVRNIAGDYRGPVAIHAGLADFEQHNMASVKHRAAHGTNVDSGIVFGAIIGVVDLVGAHKGHNSERTKMLSVRSCYQPGKPFGPCSGWSLPDNWHLELANPRALRTPIPFKGALGLRTLDPSVVAQIESQLA